MEPIAVVGLGLRFPQEALTPDTFWDLLVKKKCASSDWPKERVNIDAFRSSAHREPSSIAARGAHFLRDDPSLFDASFFSITASEAAALDPQQCMLLETTYQAFENAGIPLETLRGSNTGVYTGTMCDDHKHQVLKDIDSIPTYAATGSSSAVLANRVSWFFDLTGPSMTLDTACSSSLIALHLACQGLLVKETSMAVVGGTNVLLGVEAPITMTRMGFLSPDGRCFSFDDRANGYARGEGVGVVILKRLSDAIANNDTIRAVIRATGTNQDGYTPGITVPNKLSQARLIKETYERAGLDLASTRYFESHGTGTAVGDPLEASAIGSVFAAQRSESDPLYIGTLKPNIGHLEGGSGVAGLIKTVLVLEKGIIPPNANLHRLNPRIPPELLSYLQFPTVPTPWPDHGVRRASVNSFGFGGSNAHAIVDDADGYFREHGLIAHHSTARPNPVLVPNGIAPSGVQTKLLVLSATSESALTHMTDAYSTHFRKKDLAGPDEGLTQDLAYTLSCRRTHHDWRSYAIVDSNIDLKDLKRHMSKPVRVKKHAGITFAFTGQGAQYKRMGLQLLPYPEFRETLLSCDSIYQQLGCSWSLLDVLSSDSGNIDHPSYSQPLSTALQISLIKLLASFNIVPTSVVGHSSGEIAAAYAAGGISLESACRLSYFRGQLAGSLVDFGSDGTMLAVALSETKTLAYFHRLDEASEPLAIACINSPDNVTVGGPRPDVLRLKELLDLDGVFCRELKTGVAYHTSQMESVAGRYRQAIGQLEPGPKSKQHASMASSVTGDWIWSLEELCVPEYWVQNMVQTVRFNAAVTKLLRSSSEPRSDVVMTDVVEVGPHSALQRPIGEVIASLNHDVRYSSALSRFDPTARSILDLAGRLHCSGFAVQLAKVNGIVASQESKYKCLTDLPAYVFNHSQRPLKYNMATDIRQRPHFPSPLLGAPAPSWNPLEPTWRRNLNTQQFPWLVDHQINGATLFPAAGMLAVALEAAYCTVKKEPPISGICIKQATFSHPIVISTGDDSGTDIETRLRSTSLSSTEESSSYEVNIYVRQGRDWTQAFRGTVQVMHEESASSRELSGGQSAMLQEWKTKYNEAVETCRRQVKTSAIYPHLSKLGMQYGPAFQGLENVYYNGDSSAVGKINASKMQALSSGGAEFYFVHPAVLDSLIHLAWVIRTEGATSLIATSVPARLRSIWFSKEWLRGDNIKQQELRTCNTAVAHGFGGLDTSAVVVGESGEVVLSLEHLQTTMSARDHMNQESRVSKRLCYRLETKPDIDNLDSTQLKSLLHANGTPLADYLELIAHKNPGVKVLDLTADTEGSRSFFFHRQRNTPFFDTYDLVHKVSYEDIRVKYPNECSAGRIQLKTLDLESSPLLQGFALGSYDVVLFPARDLPSTSKSHALKHIRDMLRTGGKLIIIDTPLPVKLVTSAELHSSEPTQTYRPELLKKSGFVGMDVSFQQHGTEDRRDNFTVSTAQDTVNSSKPPANFVIVIEDSVGQKALASRIQSAMLSKWELKASVVLLSQISSASLHSQAYIIFLADTQRAFLGSMAREEFEKLKVLLNAGKGTFWVTKEARTSDTGPSLSMITGLARVLRSENPSRGFVTTALESSSTAAEDAEILLKVFQSFLGSDGPNETEYIVRNGVIHIQRVVENEAVDESIISKTIPQERKLPLSELETVELEIQNPGVFDSLRCVPLQQGSAALADDEVEVQVFAFGLNFKDVVIALGRLPQNKLGCECAGVITKAGRNVRLKVGTRVMMAQNGCMKTVNRCHQDLVVAIPSTLGFEEAAAIPIAGATAYYSLVEQARLQKDETVLIHSGAGATGQMCLQIALSIGAKVYTTVGSQEKREFLMWRYGLNEDQIFYSRDTSFAPSIMSATQNQGVDVVVNSLAGDRLQASWEVVAPFGRFVELGRTEIIGNSKLAMAHFAKNVSFMAVAIDDMVTLRPALVQKILSAVVEMISQDKLRLPYPLRVRPLSEAEDAFRHLMSGKSTGKLVLKVNPQDVVRAYTVQNSGKSLSPNASYLIAGGFGGLGRSAARWMVSKGARNLILLSRSGPTSASAQLLVSELQDAGVRVVARACDVASEKELSAVLSKDTEDMPPIRGCIQGTMALRDATFDNMTYEDWDTSIRSKVSSSINLDRLLPRGMDFFIMLSSLSGIVGLKGQANYAAGNTFQDALAHARVQRGERAVALDLGAMSKIGVIAENEHLGHLAKTHMLPVGESEFHALLDHYCFASNLEAQCLVGLPTPEYLHSNGGELPEAYEQPLFSHLRNIGRNEASTASSEDTKKGTTDYARRFKAATSAEEAAAVVVEGLVAKLSHTLSVPVEDIDPTKPLHAYGVDSLVAVELRNWFAKEFASNVAIFNFVGAPCIQAVGGLVTEASSLKWQGQAG